MPYTVKKVDDGFKVCKKDDLKKCFSKRPMSKRKAEKQKLAIVINESFKKMLNK